MSRSQELDKQKALNIISNMTSARNPSRFSVIAEIIEKWGEASDELETQHKQEK